MITGFLPHKEITTPNELFGRTQLLKHLQILANNRNTVSLIGLRRFGKTSVLKCLEHQLRTDAMSRVYPLYFDFKEIGSIVKGTDNVYRHMIAKLVEKLFLDGHFPSTETFKKKTIVPSNDWTDIYLDLMDVNPVRIQSLFEEIVSFFSGQLKKTILFLFDEYEHLFRFSFDQPEGFMKLRNFSSKVVDENIVPFSFFVSGAVTWEHLCTVTGSGELNCIDHTCFVSPIEICDFKQMWITESNKIENCSEEVANGWEFAFKSSGGVPFYGKLVGSNWIIKKEVPGYFILQSYFQELLNSLTIEQRSILSRLAKGVTRISTSNYILDMIEKGLIFSNENEHGISIQFLKDYLLAENIEIGSVFERTRQEILVESIANLMITINNTYKAKKGQYIFEPVNDDHALMNDLRASCTSSAMFSDFSSSLYKIVFEKTKATVKGRDIVLGRLPAPFRKGYQFIDIVDIMRHSLGGGHLMGKFTPRPKQLSKEKMLTILIKSRNEPNTPEEFSTLQIATLELFVAELNKLNTIVRSLP